MTEAETTIHPGRESSGKFSWLQVTAIVAATAVLTLGVTLWVVKIYIFPSQFKPVVLTSQEHQQLSSKLSLLGYAEDTGGSPASSSPLTTVRSGQAGRQSADENLDEPLQPVPYSEQGASREVSFSERELNGMLAKNTDLATKMAIDLSDNLISARLRIPVDEDFPIFAGKTIRAAAGVELAYRNERPVVKLKGVKLMGVPIPNAWLGGLKNIDLVQEFGGEEGFWQLFSDGVQSIEAKEGELLVILKE